MIDSTTMNLFHKCEFMQINKNKSDIFLQFNIIKFINKQQIVGFAGVAQKKTSIF